MRRLNQFLQVQESQLVVVFYAYTSPFLVASCEDDVVKMLYLWYNCVKHGIREKNDEPSR